MENFKEGIAWNYSAQDFERKELARACSRWKTWCNRSTNRFCFRTIFVSRFFFFFFCSCCVVVRLSSTRSRDTIDFFEFFPSAFARRGSVYRWTKLIATILCLRLIEEEKFADAPLYICNFAIYRDAFAFRAALCNHPRGLASPPVPRWPPTQGWFVFRLLYYFIYLLITIDHGAFYYRLLSGHEIKLNRSRIHRVAKICVKSFEIKLRSRQWG